MNFDKYLQAFKEFYTSNVGYTRLTNDILNTWSEELKSKIINSSFFPSPNVLILMFYYT